MMKKILITLLLFALLCPMFLFFSPKAEAASYTAAQWKTLADRFNVFLCGDKTNDMSNSSVKAIVTKIDNNCTTYWTKLKNMRSAGVTKGLFDESVDNPNEMGWQYIYLWYMAQAYGTYGSLCARDGHLLEQTTDLALTLGPLLLVRVECTDLVDDTLQNRDDRLRRALHKRILPSVDPDGEVGRIVDFAEIVSQQVHQRGLTASPLALQSDCDRGVCQLDILDKGILVDLNTEQILLGVFTRNINNA